MGNTSLAGSLILLHGRRQDPPVNGSPAHPGPDVSAWGIATVLKVLEDLPASCCQSQRKMGFVGFVKPTDKTPLETADVDADVLGAGP
ncbi:hypothetical protein D4764_05G0001110 [Takifugu flavidus]|uniref:Uncharacterized protein n=1 Tax=Takifugu flavidus TaxID=433684 RepID=A0A5C6N141_9TELE|nr:hypothetical protein D4764_05G0001110 [Takifugu flavidus]